MALQRHKTSTILGFCNLTYTLELNQKNEHDQWTIWHEALAESSSPSIAGHLLFTYPFQAFESGDEIAVDGQSVGIALSGSSLVAFLLVCQSSVSECLDIVGRSLDGLCEIVDGFVGILLESEFDIAQVMQRVGVQRIYGKHLVVKVFGFFHIVVFLIIKGKGIKGHCVAGAEGGNRW